MYSSPSQPTLVPLTRELNFMCIIPKLLNLILPHVSLDVILFSFVFDL